jgi:hypothetical protein
MSSLALIPITIGDAKVFIGQRHRTHEKPPGSALFAVAVGLADSVVGVALIGRPKARRLQDGWTAEVVRVCTDGTRNACSMLYGAAWRAARALGYRKLITYTLQAEGGASLRAAGWRVVGETRGGSWDRTPRPRVDRHPTQSKLRWEAGEVSQ